MKGPELKDFLFKVKTHKGVFWVTLEGETEGAAEMQLWRFFQRVDLPYQEVSPRTQNRGDTKQGITIGSNGTIYAGKLFWQATGRGVEFEAYAAILYADANKNSD